MQLRDDIEISYRHTHSDPDDGVCNGDGWRRINEGRSSRRSWITHEKTIAGMKGGGKEISDEF